MNGERLVWHTRLWEGAWSALYLKLPDRRLTLILLANSDALQWEQRFDEAAIERSPFAYVSGGVCVGDESSAGTSGPP